MTKKTFYAAGEQVLGVMIAILTISSIAVGFLFGARDVRHYLRIRKI
jgi:hypothetical protein